MANFTDTDRLVYAPLEITAVSTDVGVELQYLGTEDYADVEVAAATGDITLKHGADSSSEAVDTDVGLPLATPGLGIIDVSDAEANTVGEVLDHLNASRRWRIRAMAMRRADLMTDTLITLAQTQCNISAVGLLRDSTVAVQTNTFTIGARVSAKRLDGPGSGAWTNRISRISGTVSFATAGTGTGYNDGDGALNSCRIVVYSINNLLKTQRRVWKSDPLTSGVAFDFRETDWGALGLSGDPGEDLLVLVQNSGTGATTIITPTLKVEGYREPGGTARLENWHLSNN